MNKQEYPSLGSIKISKIKWLLDKLERDYGSNQDFLRDLDLSFEFIIGSLFPEAIINMRNNLNQQHTLGYIEGYDDGIKSRKKKVTK